MSEDKIRRQLFAGPGIWLAPLSHFCHTLYRRPRVRKRQWKAARHPGGIGGTEPRRQFYGELRSCTPIRRAQGLPGLKSSISMDVETIYRADNNSNIRKGWAGYGMESAG